jgi:glycosyltransferase involved in cell wall biosynthesis
MAREPQVASVCVVVPTRDRPRPLARCLDALERERVGLTVLEVLVVDDGSIERSAVAEAVAAHPDVRLLRLEEPRCAGTARNYGTLATVGELVLFTDDDCIPEPGWAAALVGRLQAGADVVAGPTLNGRAGSALAEASQAVANAFLASGRGGSPAFAPTSNIGVRTDLARRLAFDERYGGAGEDRDWFERVLDGGHTIAFAPEARVQHFQELGLRRFWRRHLMYGRSAYWYRRAHRGGRLEAPSFYVRLVGEGFRAGVRVGLAVCLAQLATAIGFAAETRRSRSGG